MWCNNVPGVGSCANDSDGGAGKSDEGGDILGVDAQKSKDGTDGGASGRLDALAALDGPSVALVTTKGSGNRKGGEGESDKSRELELHV